MKLKKPYIAAFIVFFIILIILFYPRILPTVDARSTSKIIIEKS